MLKMGAKMVWVYMIVLYLITEVLVNFFEKKIWVRHGAKSMD